METSTPQITRIPLKYLNILETLSKESVWKIFINILWWNEKLDKNEVIFYNLIMTDVNNINKLVEIWKKQGHHWIKWWRPKKITPGGYENKPLGVGKANPNISKGNINEDNISEDKERKVKINKGKEKVKKISEKKTKKIEKTENVFTETENNLEKEIIETENNLEDEKTKSIDIIETWKWFKPKKKIFKGRSELSEKIDGVINIVTSHCENGITDDSKEDIRNFGKLLVQKLDKLRWDFDLFNYLDLMIWIVKEDQFHWHKTKSIKKLYFSLVELSDIAKKKTWVIWWWKVGRL